MDASAELEIVPVGGEYEAEPMRETVLIYHLPNFAQDRRSDLRAARVKVGSIDDMARFNELFRAHANAPGFYLQEHRIGGQVAQTKVVEVKPRVETFSDTVTGMTGGQAQHETSAAQPIVAATEMLRAAKDFAKEAAPPVAVAPSLSPADIQKMISDTLAASQPAAPVAQPKTLIEQLRELQTARAILREDEPQGAAARGTDLSDEQRLQLAFLNETGALPKMFKELRAAIGTVDRVDEPQTWADWGKDVIRDFIPHVAPHVAPMVVPLAMAVMPTRIKDLMAGAGITDAAPATQAQPQATGAQAQPTPQPQPQQQPAMPETAAEAFILTAHVAAADMTRGKRPGRVADLIDEQLIKFPELRKAVDEVCEMSPEQVLATIQQMTGRTDLASYTTSLFYIENLQDELRPETDDDSPGEDQTDAPSIIQMASAQTQ